MAKLVSTAKVFLLWWLPVMIKIKGLNTEKSLTFCLCLFIYFLCLCAISDLSVVVASLQCGGHPCELSLIISFFFFFFYLSPCCSSISPSSRHFLWSLVRAMQSWMMVLFSLLSRSLPLLLSFINSDFFVLYYCYSSISVFFSFLSSFHLLLTQLCTVLLQRWLAALSQFIISKGGAMRDFHSVFFLCCPSLITSQHPFILRLICLSCSKTPSEESLDSLMWESSTQ